MVVESIQIAPARGDGRASPSGPMRRWRTATPWSPARRNRTPARCSVAARGNQARWRDCPRPAMICCLMLSSSSGWCRPRAAVPSLAPCGLRASDDGGRRTARGAPGIVAEGLFAGACGPSIGARGPRADDGHSDERLLRLQATAQQRPPRWRWTVLRPSPRGAQRFHPCPFLRQNLEQNIQMFRCRLDRHQRLSFAVEAIEEVPDDC